MKKNCYWSLITILLFIIFLILGINFNVLNQNQNLDKHKTNHIPNNWEPKTDFWKETGRFPYLDKVYTKRLVLTKPDSNYFYDDMGGIDPYPKVVILTFFINMGWKLRIANFKKAGWKGGREVFVLHSDALYWKSFFEKYAQRIEDYYSINYTLVSSQMHPNNPYGIQNIAVYISNVNRTDTYWHISKFIFYGGYVYDYGKYKFNISKSNPRNKL